MFVLHAIWQVPADEIDAFIEWKNVEGEMQRRAPGFLERALYRSEEDPGYFVYLAIWESEGQANSYGRQPEFREKSKAAIAKMPGTKLTITRMAEVPGQRLRRES